MIRLGILGGGQLAQMLIQAAISLGIDVAVFDRNPDSPASRLTHFEVAGAWENETLLESFAAMCDVVTLENDVIDAHILRKLQDTGLPVYPTAETVTTVQDKLLQKQYLEEAGLPVPQYRPVTSPADVLSAAETFGFPLLLKVRRDAYDEIGNAWIGSPAELAVNWIGYASGGRELIAEAALPDALELSVAVVRSRDGEVRAYPVVEVEYLNDICHIVRAPARISAEAEARAQALANLAVELLDGVGIFGVELYLTGSGDVLVNEIAARTHNAAHYTIEACVTSQFENHIRAVAGLPLGSVDMHAPAAVMVNLLGKRNGAARNYIHRALAVAGAYVHLYNKREVRLKRKMGHITALGMTIAEAEAIALEAAQFVEF